MERPLLICLWFGCALAPVQAQLIYTDVVPDTVLHTNLGQYALDLDNNGLADFNLKFTYATGLNCSGSCAGTGSTSAATVSPLNGNAVMDTSAYYPNSIPVGDTISAAMPFNAALGQILRSYSSVTCVGPFCQASLVSGHWNLAVPGFLGLRLDVNGATHYGWVRMALQPGLMGIQSVTVMDYAWNSVPDGPIVAGDTLGTLASGIAAGTLSALRLSPVPCASTLYISSHTPRGAMTAVVRSMNGQALLQRSLPDAAPWTLDLATLAPGMYLLELNGAGERVVRKFVKE